MIMMMLLLQTFSPLVACRKESKEEEEVVEVEELDLE